MSDTTPNARDNAIAKIRKGLRTRSGKVWSVTGGRGTGYGWIHITSPPARRVDGNLSAADQIELGELLGLSRPAYHQGEDVPASGDYRVEYIDRAEGRTPSTYARQYWD